MPTERLWITEPRRATCLSVVTAVRGEQFTVDRCLFAPTSRAYRHPQYADEGIVLLAGEKRRLEGVQDREGDVWLRLRGTVPAVGETLQCQLDQDIRGLSDRAHTAMHLMLAALRGVGAPPHSADPEVKGGGCFRLTLRAPIAPPLLKQALDAANAAAAANVQVGREFASGEVIRRLASQQPFHPPDPFPGPDPAPLVRIGEVAYPCDGTHVDRTGKVGRIVIEHARMGSHGFVMVGKVV